MRWRVLWIWLAIVPLPLALCDKYFHALLSGTLKTFQQAACEDQLVSLRCPAGTCISVLVAQYGQSASDQRALCRGDDDADDDDANRKYNATTTAACVWPTSVQDKWEAAPEGDWGKYSLLQTVMEACHKKRQCNFHASSNHPSHSPSPCPGVRKYVEVAYKCRPYEFRSKVACQSDSVQLQCNPHSRVAVYSASYGRTEYESVRCPQPQGVREETCLATYATETVMQLCHGRRQCALTADAATFSSSPCQQPNSKTYLKVVYTCVPKTVLREQLEGEVGEDERRVVDPDLYGGNSPDYEEGPPLRENRVQQRQPPPPANTSASGGHADAHRPPQPPPPPPSQDPFQEQRDRVVLMLVFAVSCGLALLAALVSLRLALARLRRGRGGGGAVTKGGDFPEEDTASEIDLTTTTATVLPPASPQEVIRYKRECEKATSAALSPPDYYYG